MSTPKHEADVPTDPATDEQDLGGLTVEDDPEGTVDPADLAGTASDDDEDVR
jgi:hypothetical protein